MFNYIQSLAFFIKKYLSIVVLSLVFLLSLFYTSFIYSSWYPVIVENEITMSLVKLLLGIIIFTLIIYLTKVLNKKTLIILIVLINFIGIILKLFLVFSIKNYPVHDSWHMMHSLNQILNNIYETFQPGGYLITHKHQLGLATVLLPVIKIFGYEANGIFIFQALLLQLTFIVFTFGIYIKRGVKSAFVSSALFSLFLPNTFSIFLFYGDIYSLFYLSMSLLVYLLINKVNRISIKLLFYTLIYIFLSLAYFARATSGVLILALVIFIIITYKSNIKKYISILSLLSVFVVPVFINQQIYSSIFNYDVNKYSLPSNTYLRVGTSYSSWDDKSAGYYDFEVGTDFTNLKFDHNKMSELNKKIIVEQINNLYNNNELYDFMKTKLSIAWSDADFEMATYLLPFSGQIFQRVTIDSPKDYFGTGAFDLVPLNKFGDFLINQYFNIRNVEKIYLLGLQFTTFVLFIFCNKKKEISILQITLIGMFLYMMLFEVKSRYLWVFMNIWIVSISFCTEDLVLKLDSCINFFKYKINKLIS